MTDENLAEQLEYSSSDCLYIITWNNVFKQLFTPFKVLVLNDIGQLSIGEVVWVEQVKVTYELKTVFVIDSKAYYYFHFDFIID